MESMMLMICLIVVTAAAYYMGKQDGEKAAPSDETWADVQKYEIDKRFAHMRWMAEREHHDNL